MFTLALLDVAAITGFAVVCLVLYAIGAIVYVGISMAYHMAKKFFRDLLGGVKRWKFLTWQKPSP